LFNLRVNKGDTDATAVFPDALDTHALYGGGFKLTDFVESGVYLTFDYFRIKKVTAYATWVNPTQISINQGGAADPPGSNSLIEVWASVDHDDGTTPSSVSSFMRRQNKTITCLTHLSPRKKIVTYVPHRRISTNVDPSQQIVTDPKEWCDARYADTIIFGNLKMAVVAPGGRLGYDHNTNPKNVHDRATYPNIKIQYVAEVEFKGKQ